MAKITVADTRDMGVEEVIALIEGLWERVAEETASQSLPDWQRDELDRRIAEEDAGEAGGSSWDDVKARIRTGTGSTVPPGTCGR